MPSKPRPLFDPRDVPAALGLLTRLPVKVNTTFALERGAAAAWAYPLAGLVTSVCAIIFGAAAMATGLGPDIAAGLAIAAQIIVTGALHEDGLADCADGFWGGWTRARRLDIMKDSQIGTYGVLALTLGVGLKWIGLATLIGQGPGGWLWLMAAACVSRGGMVWVMATLPHARPGGLGASVGRPSRHTACTALALAAVIGALTVGVAGAIWAVLLCLGIAILGGRLAKTRIGGQTGDVLGAVQMITETGVILLAVALI